MAAKRSGRRAGASRDREDGRRAEYSESEESDGGSSSGSDLGSHGGFRNEDPRTMSQIKRSRVDLDKRYVFLCPMFLAKNFDMLPQQAKDSALLVFRCSRSWVFQEGARKRRGDVSSKVDCGLSRRPQTSPAKTRIATAVLVNDFSAEFQKWLLIKEKEGCVFWLTSQKDLKDLSDFFEEKIDPLNEQPYRPLLLDPHWWRVRFAPSAARYIVNANVVINNISAHAGAITSARAAFDTPALQELIYQSNPTLEPISRWPHAPSMRFHPSRSPGREGDPMSGVAFDFLQRQLGRIAAWPISARERRDDLHSSWRAEDALSERRHLLGAGRSLVRNV